MFEIVIFLLGVWLVIQLWDVIAPLMLVALALIAGTIVIGGFAMLLLAI